MRPITPRGIVAVLALALASGPLCAAPVVLRASHQFPGGKGDVLRSHEIRTCIVTGVSTNVCVESTLRAAFDLGYYIVVPRDATASWSEQLGDATLANVTHRFGIVSSVAEIVDAWRG